MKVYIVTVTFKDVNREGVLFTDKHDAIQALSGDCESGSTLAVSWCEIYGDTKLKTEMTEIEL